MKNIVLCGFMGSGKTTVGKKLAGILNMRFVDTDALIEKQEGMSISDIFALKGEEYFRKTEAELIDSLKSMTNTVIATGGGFPVNKLVMPRIKEIGTVVLLNVSDKIVLKRVFGDSKRPLVSGKSAQDVITLYNSRKKNYSLVADIIVNADISAKQVALSIAKEVSACR